MEGKVFWVTEKVFKIRAEIEHANETESVKRRKMDEAQLYEFCELRQARFKSSQREIENKIQVYHIFEVPH